MKITINFPYFRTIFLLSLLVGCSSPGGLPDDKAPDEVVLGIQPYGEVSQELIDSVSASIHAYYGFQVVVLLMKDLPKSAFVNIKSPRYRADSLISILKRNKPDSIDFILGLTNSGISTTKRTEDGEIKKPESRYTDWGIFGLGYCPGVSCVVSTQYFQHKDKVLFIERLRKICMHEVGHNLGLPHCENGVRCVMRDAAETIRTIDNVDAKLCDHCTSEIGN